MPSWKGIFDEIQAEGTTFDIVRRRYLQKLFEHTERNVIAYYSGWLQKPELLSHTPVRFSISDEDKTGFMACIYEMDRDKGLDLILHTPGGDIAATESIVDYLRRMFNTNIRVIIPQIAMSAGTMIACASSQIILGKHSSLGPIDPQYLGLPAHAVIEEFERARQEIRQDHSAIPLWQPIISKYNPTFIGECEKAIEWSCKIVEEWLLTGMLRTKNPEEARTIAQGIVKELGDHALTKSHARHVSIQQAQDMGLDIIPLEEDQTMQESVLSVHHAFIHTLTSTSTVKIIENHNGIASVSAIHTK